MKQLLLLHGAIGAAQQLETLSAQLSDRYKVYTLNFTGHGGRPSEDTHFAMELFANDVLDFLKQEQLNKISIFGYSMGGYVGMYLAKHHPAKIGKIITLGTKYHWDETVAAKEVQMLNPDKIAQKVPAFAESLQQLHAPNDWKEVLNKTAEMMTALGRDSTLKPEDYKSIDVPALILLGDRDKMVSLEETLAVYKSLPHAQLGILPNTSHPIDQVSAPLLSYVIKHYLE